MMPIGRRVLLFVVGALALVILIGALTGERGYLEVRARRAQHLELGEQVRKLEIENAALMRDIQALKTDPYVIEKLAREKLGYARPGEMIYLFPAPPPPPPAAE